MHSPSHQLSPRSPRVRMTRVLMQRAWMQRAWMMGVALAALGAPRASYAADWLTLQGTERGRQDTPLQAWGFVQLRAEAIASAPIASQGDAQLEPFEGRRASFNVFEDDMTRASFNVQRLRVGARGSFPGTRQRLVYFVSSELGQSVSKEASPARIMDASITMELSDDVRLRAGQFKLPTMDETLQSNILTADLIDRSHVSSTLLRGAPRDVGVQLSGSPRWGALELSWALGLTNGLTLGAEQAQGDLQARAQLSWLRDPARALDPMRQGLEVFAWGVGGRREQLSGPGGHSLRAGAGAQGRLGGWRLRLESVWADGYIKLEPRMPFVGQPSRVDAQAQGWGATALVTYRPLAWLELTASAHHLRLDPAEPQDARRADEQVLGARVFLHPRVKLTANMTLRQTELELASPALRQVYEGQGPRYGVQLSGLF